MPDQITFQVQVIDKDPDLTFSSDQCVITYTLDDYSSSRMLVRESYQSLASIIEAIRKQQAPTPSVSETVSPLSDDEIPF